MLVKKTEAKLLTSELTILQIDRPLSIENLEKLMHGYCSTYMVVRLSKRRYFTAKNAFLAFIPIKPQPSLKTNKQSLNNHFLIIFSKCTS